MQGRSRNKSQKNSKFVIAQSHYNKKGMRMSIGGQGKQTETEKSHVIPTVV